MRIYTKILIIVLPLIAIPMLLTGVVTFELTRLTILNATRELLDAKLADALNASTENYEVLRLYGLENIPSNIQKAQEETFAALNAIRFGQTGYVFVVDGTGVIQSHPNQNLVGTTVADQPWFAQILRRPGGLQLEIGLEQGNRQASAQYFEPWNWYLVSSRAEAEIFGPVLQVGRYAILIGVFILGLACLPLLFFIRQLTRPLQTLAEAAEKVGQGDLDIDLQLKSKDELGQLARVFNTMAEQIREFVNTLEERVASRTRRLEQLAIISGRLSAILNTQDLLKEVVEQIKDKFGYYHAHIYLIDEKQQKLIVAAGTGPAGEEMMAKGHNILVSAKTSLVARAARSGEIVWVDNVRTAPDWLPNPLLPNTYSEMAVPILLGQQVVGVLDVQEDSIGALDEGDAGLLRSLAGQVAVAIRNARQFAEVETALTEAQAAQERYEEQAWTRVKEQKLGGEYLYRRADATPLTKALVDQLERQALGHNRPTAVTVNGRQAWPGQEQPSQTGEAASAPETAALVAPIKLKNQAIGTIQLLETERQRNWNEQELALVNIVADQVAQAAENLRLFGQTREVATREQAIREVTDKLRSAPNLEALLEIAAREVGQRLDVPHTIFELGISSSVAKTKAAPDTNLTEGE